MYEAILSEDGEYNIPDDFESRAVRVLEVYLKSLGVRMETIVDEDEYIKEPEHSDEIIDYHVGNATIVCTVEEMYYLKKLHKVYRKYLKEHPNEVDDVDDVWAYIVDNLPFGKKHLTDNIVSLFRENLEYFAQAKEA